MESELISQHMELSLPIVRPQKSPPLAILRCPLRCFQLWPPNCYNTSEFISLYNQYVYTHWLISPVLFLPTLLLILWQPLLHIHAHTQTQIKKNNK